MFIHSMYAFLVAGTVLFSCVHASDAPLSYVDIGRVILQAEDSLKQDVMGTLDLVTKKPVKEKKQKLSDVNLQVHALSPFQQKRLCFLLFQKFGTPNTSQPLLTLDGVEKLNLVSGAASAREHSLLRQIPTQTVFGSVAAARLLASPHTNASEIKAIQQGIQLLLESPKAYAQAVAACGSIAQVQGNFLANYEQNEALQNKAIAQVYFPAWMKWLNASPVALTVSRTWQEVSTNDTYLPIRFLRDALIFHIAMQLVMQPLLEATAVGWVKTKYKTLPPHIKAEYPIDRAIEEAQSFFTRKSLQELLQNILPQGTTVRGALRTPDSAYQSSIIGGMTAYELVTGIFGYSKRAGDWQVNHAALEHIKAKVYATTQVIVGLSTVYALAEKNPVLYASEPRLRAIKSFMQDPDSSVQQLLSLSNTRLFDTQGKSIIEPGDMLAAYTALEKVKYKMVPALEAAGAFDALCGVTKLYQDSQATDKPFCFVELDAAPEATIKLHDLWNPLIASHHQAVTNDIILDSKSAQNMVITGPNGSGKSVFMYAVAQNIVLGHAWGLAAARTAQMSVYNKILINVNPREDLQAQMSTFMSEIKELETTCELVKKLPADQKSFVLIDEGLKGTVENTGGLRLFNAGKLMSEKPNTICLMATHFKRPTELEGATGGNFSNYHVGLREPQKGNFERTFKLIKGKNDWWFNDHEKRERFIEWLEQEMYRVIHRTAAGV